MNTSAQQLLEMATQAFALQGRAGEEVSDIASRLTDNLELLMTAPVEPVNRRLIGRIVADILLAESMHWIEPAQSMKMQNIIDGILGE